MQAHAQAALQDSLPLADLPPADPAPATQDPARAASGPQADARADADRALRVVGVSDDGDRVLCVDAQAGAVSDAAARPRYTLTIDERLRAAVRGNRRGAADGSEGEIDMAPGLRPREIQSRIRAGATVEQVAAAAGCPAERIEGFAYPVLLERATVADRARATQPRGGSGDTLEEIVTATLVDRGQQQNLAWDAFKDERGWIVALTWQAGRSENRAEWAYSARPGGGTVTALGSEAADLLEPGRSQLRPVDQLIGRGDRHDAAPGHGPAAQTGATEPVGEAADARTAPPSHGAGHDSARPAAAHASSPASSSPGQAARTSRRGHRPQMPSWEDVLLGTRTAEH